MVYNLIMKQEKNAQYTGKKSRSGCQQALFSLPFPFQFVEITFTAFSLENAASTGCVWDWVKIYDGTTLVMTKCGSDSPGTFTSSGNIAKVEFHSDYSVTSTGFSATISFSGCPAAPGPCPGGPAEMVIANGNIKTKPTIS